MRIELPSGAHIDVLDPDQFKGSLRKKVRRAIHLTVSPDGVQETSGGIDDDLRDAMLAEIITGWSLAEDRGIPVPSAGGGPDVIADALSAADYNALQDAAQPLLEQVLGRGSRPNVSGNGRSPSS